MSESLISKILHNRYRIQSLLGRQTGRRTFLALDLQTSLSVVVKLMLFGVDFVWDDLKLFERETHVLQSLDHPAIPRYLDGFEVETNQGKGFALVQTHLEARSLQDWVQSGRTFSEAELKVIAQDLLSVLDYLHHRQPAVVHRDIKPSNILLGERSGNHPGQVYLVDFGSVQVGRQDGTRTIVGTYGYMPLEQFGGHTTPASDLYALGATLIYLATGHHPADLPQPDLRIAFEDQVNLSPDRVDWLQWMTEPGVERRPRSAAQALAALEHPHRREQRAIAVSQPLNSRVKVTHTEQLFEVLTLPRGIDFNFIGSMIFASCSIIMGLAGFACLCLIKQTPLALILLLSALVLVPFTAAGVCIFWTSLVTAFGRVRLRMTPSDISLSSELFRRRYRAPLIAARSSVSRVELTTGFYQEVAGGPYHNAYLRQIVPQINIWVGAKSIPIGSGLTLPELEWLAQEVSHWLNLPISRNEVPE
jgi:serine/threonine protein kinase